MTCGIYMITNKKTKQKYIGQSTDIERRWYQHLKGYNYTDGYIDKAIRKHGKDNFYYTIIEELPNDSQVLNQREKFWIDYYDTYKNKEYYNLVVGGAGLGSGKNHPCFKNYYHIRTKGRNSANNKNYALINPNGEDIKYSIDRKELENDINNLLNGVITEDELLKKHYRIVKHGFAGNKQRYVLVDPNGKHLKNSVDKNKLINMMMNLKEGV